MPATLQDSGLGLSCKESQVKIEQFIHTQEQVVRRLDRQRNGAKPGALQIPNMYVLYGGYCGFHKSFPERCIPEGEYVKE